MAEPMQTDPVAAAAAAPSKQQKQKIDRLTEGRDAPWVEKYRPKTLDDVAAHKEIIDTSKLHAPLQRRLCWHLIEVSHICAVLWRCCTQSRS